jgi:hypothetical protein
MPVCCGPVTVYILDSVTVDAPHAPLPSLEGRKFVMVASTASEVNPESPSRFEYHENNGLIWGDYTGDTVTAGRFVGSRIGDVLDVRFAHVLLSDGAVVIGSSASRVESDGELLTLVEDFVIDGVDHVSTCVEVG